MIANGVDIVDCSRMEKALSRHEGAFNRRVYTATEEAICLAKGKHATESFAARYAAKEAVSKALGTGIGPEGVSLQDIEILAHENESPYVVLHEAALHKYEAMHGKCIAISLSHDGGMAIAFCTIEYEGAEK